MEGSGECPPRWLPLSGHFQDHLILRGVKAHFLWNLGELICQVVMFIKKKITLLLMNIQVNSLLTNLPMNLPEKKRFLHKKQA